MKHSQMLLTKIVALASLTAFCLTAHAEPRCVNSLSGLKRKDKDIAQVFSDTTGSANFANSNWKSEDGTDFSLAPMGSATVIKLKGVPDSMIPALAASAHMTNPDGSVPMIKKMMLKKFLSSGFVQFNAKLCISDDKKAMVQFVGTGLANGKTGTLILNRDDGGDLKISIDMEGQHSESSFGSY